MFGRKNKVVEVKPDDDEPAPGESTPLISTSITGGGRGDTKSDVVVVPSRESLSSFRRKSVAKLSVRQTSLIADVEDSAGGIGVDIKLQEIGNLPEAYPIEGLAPLFPNGGITEYDGRGYVPYREASLIKSTPAFAPYRRKARHRSFYLWWTNEFRHWWKSSRLLVRLAGLYVYSYDPVKAPAILILDPEKHKTIKKLTKFAKQLGQGGPVREFIKTVKPFTRSMRMLVGSWRWFEAAPCRRDEVGLEEFMAFIGNRVSRMVARTASDDLGFFIVFPIQRYLFRQDMLVYPQEFHPIVICVCLGIIRAVSPFAASFQGSRVGRVLTRRFFSSAKNRWLPTQRIENLNLRSDDCQEKDEVNQTASLVTVAHVVAKALGEVQTSGDGGEDGVDVVRQHEALKKEGFKQVGAGSGGYAVYHYTFHFQKMGSTNVLLHVTPYGPSITDVMPYYLVLEFETSCDLRNKKWGNSLTSLSNITWQGPQVLEGYCYQGAFFSPHHFAELKEMYDKQLLAYEAACKKLPVVAKNHRETCVPNDLPTLKKFLETGKRSRKVKQNVRERNELQKVVSSVAKEILGLMKEERKKVGADGKCLAPKGVILYFEGLDCSGKSSTGGLVQAALEECGYTVGMRQYNRPPTAEQRARPWMDRFDVPGKSSIIDLTPNTTDDDEEDTEHIAMVWDRGPAGDFVYGNLNELSVEDKKKRYEEFMAFDRQCRDNDILFLKLLFVTNRDSIAKTLGKRLAQKKMARDLTTWLNSCRERSDEEEVHYEGLEEIAAHIDPTDFTAFNNYERNLRIFSNVALNTDNEDNPWVVVNTGDRYAARKSLMKVFRSHVHDFKSQALGKKTISLSDTRNLSIKDMMGTKFSASRRHILWAWITAMALLLLASIYGENTKWDQAWFRTPTKYNITSLLDGGGLDDDSILGPTVVADETPKKGKGDKEPLVEVAEDKTEEKKGKTSKEKKRNLVESGDADEVE